MAERAPEVLVALEAALALEEEDGEVPAPVLVEHLMDSRRKEKLLLTQLQVLQSLLGLVKDPNPGPPVTPPDLREAVSEARGRWRELKARYGEALAALEGALPPALAQLEKGQRLLQRLRRARERQKKDLQVKMQETRGRRDQLQQLLEPKRQERLCHQGALRRQRWATQRAEAGCRLYQFLEGGPGAAAPSCGGVWS